MNELITLLVVKTTNNYFIKHHQVFLTCVAFFD